MRGTRNRARAPLTAVSAGVLAGVLAGLLLGAADATANDATRDAVVHRLDTTGNDAAVRAQIAIRPGRLALGDSVMLGASSRLRKRGFAVNATESRQVADGVAIVKAKRANGTLPRTVVVHLGTNGTFTFAQCRAMHRAAGAHRRLFVTTIKVRRSWTKGDNRVLRRCAARYLNTFLIDWQQRATGRPSYFYSDGFHLTPRGARVYARMMDRATS